MANVSKLTIGISLTKQSLMARPTFIDLNPDKYNQGLCYCLFMVKLDICNGSCNTFDYPSDRICVPNKMKNVNINVFNMIAKNN